MQKQKNRKPNHLLLIALFNNMAHISSYFFRVEEMKDSLRQMRSILSEENDNEDDESFEEGEYVIFFMNAML